MTRIIIEGVEDFQDLMVALARVTYIFADGSAFTSPDHTIRTQHDQDDDKPDVPVLQTHESHQSRHVACPLRGQHLRLTECALCWSDVHQGYAIETDVLSPEAWDHGLRIIE